MRCRFCQVIERIGREPEHSCARYPRHLASHQLTLKAGERRSRQCAALLQQRCGVEIFWAQNEQLAQLLFDGNAQDAAQVANQVPEGVLGLRVVQRFVCGFGFHVVEKTALANDWRGVHQTQLSVAELHGSRAFDSPLRGQGPIQMLRILVDNELVARDAFQMAFHFERKVLGRDVKLAHEDKNQRPVCRSRSRRKQLRRGLVSTRKGVTPRPSVIDADHFESVLLCKLEYGRKPPPEIKRPARRTTNGLQKSLLRQITPKETLNGLLVLAFDKFKRQNHSSLRVQCTGD